jgi:hypothetical protein
MAANPRRPAVLATLLFCSFLWLLPSKGPAAHAVLIPAADTFILSARPTNSAGGADFFNSGTTQNVTSNRALLRFDIAARLPSNSVITSAALTLNVLQQSITDPQPSVFGLHRMLRPWGEGTNAPTRGLGLPAALGDATWLARFASAPDAWATPGGAAGLDYTAPFSSSAFISDPASYLFESTADNVIDVQFWLDHPTSDFGWVLISESEDVAMTAKQFGSREYPGLEPQLALDYLLRPHLIEPRLETNYFVFSFLAEAGQSYSVEWTTNLPTSTWTGRLELPPSAVSTNVALAEPVSSNPRFYRVTTR